jgi:hypothetical protein
MHRVPKAKTYFDIHELLIYIQKKYGLNTDTFMNWLADILDYPNNGELRTLHVEDFLHEDHELNHEYKDILQHIYEDICEPLKLSEIKIYYWY